MALIEGIVVDGSGNPVLDSQGNFRLVRLAADDKGRLVLAGTINGGLPAALGQGTMSQGLRVVLASDQSLIPVGATSFKVSANFTRPSDTTAYAIGDAISNATSSPTQMTFSSVAAANQFVRVNRVAIIASTAASTLLQASLYLFGTTLASETFNDNAALALQDATTQSGGAVIPCVETSSATNNARSEATGIDIVIQCDSSGNLYGVLQALNAYTPANAEVYYVILWGHKL